MSIVAGEPPKGERSRPAQYTVQDIIVTDSQVPGSTPERAEQYAAEIDRAYDRK